MDKDVFVKVEYVVAWAGASLTTKLVDRTFDEYDEAEALYRTIPPGLSRRIEEVAVKTQIKIILKD